eukprot:scaffold106773_cov20-Tisochrysis_lutea.AAC.2
MLERTVDSDLASISHKKAATAVQQRACSHAIWCSSFEEEVNSNMLSCHTAEPSHCIATAAQQRASMPCEPSKITHYCICIVIN